LRRDDKFSGAIVHQIQQSLTFGKTVKKKPNHSLKIGGGWVSLGGENGI